MENYLIHTLESYHIRDYEWAVYQTVESLHTNDITFKKILTACLMVSFMSSGKKDWKEPVRNTLEVIKNLGIVSTLFPRYVYSHTEYDDRDDS